MDIKLRIFLVAFALIFFAVVLRYLIIKKFNLKYALVWMLTSAVLLIIAVFPEIVVWTARLVGVDLAVNAVFLFAILFAFIIIFTLTAIVSHLNKQVYRIAQMQAVLEYRVRELEQKLEKSEEIKADNQKNISRKNIF